MVIILISSCKKDSIKSTDTKKDSDKNFYAKFKLNGTAKEFDYNPTTLFTTPLPIYVGELIATSKDNHADGITIGLNDSVAYKINKTYTQQLITIKGKTTIQGMITLKDTDGSIYYASGTIANTTLSLQFTEIADDHLKGTFTAHVIKVGSSPASYADITDGEFNLGRSL